MFKILNSKLLSFLYIFVAICNVSASAAESYPELNGQLFEAKVNKKIKKIVPTHEIAIAAIFQNEAPFLKEWIEFHKLVGVQHFYLYNNLSDDNYIEVLKPYLDNHEVDLIDWPYDFTEWKQWNMIQRRAYTNAVKRAMNEVKWLAFIDIDEFLFPVEKDTLHEFLSDYEKFGGVRVSWQCFGTSNVKRILSDELLIEKLIFKAKVSHEINHSVKSIIRPSRVLASCPSPHFFYYKPKYFAVNSNKVRYDEKQQPVVIDKIRINHYWTRDEESFEAKIISKEKRGWSQDRSRERADEYNKIMDTAILRFVSELKNRMNLPEKTGE